MNLTFTRQMQPFVFFVILYFLIFIAFFGSFANGIYFLLYSDRSFVLSLLTKFLFFCFCGLHLIFPNLGENIVCFIISPFFEEYFHSLYDFVNNKIEKSSFGFFIVIHCYVCLTFLHFFMLMFSSLDPFVEFFYQLFNLGRLWLFPLVIYTFVYTQYPKFLVGSSTLADMIGSAENVEQLGKLAKKMAIFLSDEYKKHPKAGPTVLIGSVGISGALLWGSSTTKTAKAMSDSVGGFTSSDVGNAALASSPDLEEKCSHLVQAQLNTAAHPLRISFEDFKRLLKNEPFTLTEYRTSLTEAFMANSRELGNIELANQKADQLLKAEQLRLQTAQVTSLGTQGSPAVSALASPSSSRNVSEHQEIQSCLEHYFF